VFKQVEQWAARLTGYRTVSGYHEFQYEPGAVARRDHHYAYHQRGALSYCVELWDIFQQIGMKPKKLFIDYYSQMDRADLLTLAKWDRDVNHSRIFRPWCAFHHPQIGAVELGGLDLRVGISNPPYEKLDEVCRQHSATTLRVASLLPQLSVTLTQQETVAPASPVLSLRSSITAISAPTVLLGPAAGTWSRCA
jgi:hypothetical protein